MTRLEVENDKYVKTPGILQKLLLVVMAGYILVAIVVVTPKVLEQVTKYGSINEMITFISFISVVIMILVFMVVIFYSYSYSLEYDKGTKLLTTYNDLVLLRIKTDIKNLSEYKDIDIEWVSGANKLLLIPKDETQEKLLLTNVDTRNYKKGIWKDLVEEVRKGMS